jgi:hypothetical protein
MATLSELRYIFNQIVSGTIMISGEYVAEDEYNSVIYIVPDYLCQEHGVRITLGSTESEMTSILQGEIMINNLAKLDEFTAILNLSLLNIEIGEHVHFPSKGVCLSLSVGLRMQGSI